MERISGSRGQGTSLSKGGRQPLEGLSHPQAFHGNFSFQEWLPEEFVERISQLDTQSPVTKINGKRHTWHTAELSLLTSSEWAMSRSGEN